MLRTYEELCQYQTFEDRFQYLRLDGQVGRETFGFDRYLNQDFYRSSEWKRARRHTIVRDLGCDLGLEGHEIHGSVVVHHMNPITSNDIQHGSDLLFDLRYLITTTHDTHNAIHYGDESLLPRDYIPREPGDTKLW